MQSCLVSSATCVMACFEGTCTVSWADLLWIFFLFDGGGGDIFSLSLIRMFLLYTVDNKLEIRINSN